MEVATAKVMNYWEPFHPAMIFPHSNTRTWSQDSRKRIRTTKGKRCALSNGHLNPHDHSDLLLVQLVAGTTPSWFHFSTSRPMIFFFCAEVQRSQRTRWHTSEVSPRVCIWPGSSALPAFLPYPKILYNLFTSAWKHALVQPVPKKGNRSDPSNYGLIALTSTIVKVFETVLNWQFLKQLKSNSILSVHQYGFAKTDPLPKSHSFVVILS